MLTHITKSMHLIEMMNFLFYIVTNLSSLFLLCFQRYHIQKRSNDKERTFEELGMDYQKWYQTQEKKSDGETKSLEVSGMDYQRSILHAPKPKEVPQPQAPNPTQVPRVKATIGCFDTPCCRGSRYGIHPPPIKAEAYEIKTSLIRLIQESRFLGTKVENPYDHLDSFEKLCDTFRTGGVPHDSIKLILFPFSLGGKASQWEKTLPSHLVNSWDDCKKIFLNKFYSTQRTVQTRSEILNFKQGMHESFLEAWERLKGYTRDCPHHGFKKESILNIFYLGVDQEHKWTLDAASNGRFSNLTVEQGELLVENLAQSEENYEEDYYRFPLGSGRHEDQGREEIKALDEKMDKPPTMIEIQSTRVDELLIATKRSVHFVENFNENQRCAPRIHDPLIPPQGYAQGLIPQGKHSFLTPQDVDLDGVCKQALKGQAETSTKIYCAYNDLNSRLETMTSRLKNLENQDAQGSPLSTKPMEERKDEVDESPSEYYKVIFLDENSEKALREVERVLHGSKNEVHVEEVKYIGICEKIDISSTPKACEKNKSSHEEEALGYGNVEEALALDGDSLESLFHTTMENEIETNEGQKKAKDIKAKKKKPIDNHPPTLDQFSHTMTLIPCKHDDRIIEYKVKCKGRSKPFAKVRAFLTNEHKEKGLKAIQEVMNKILTFDLKDPPWSAHTPPPA